MSFLITGLPRSGTAWMANFLTYKNLTCRHELIMKSRNFDEYVIMQQSGMGNSDSGGIMYWDEIKEALPDIPKIVISRPIEEVQQSLAKLHMPLSYGRIRKKYLQAVKEADLVVKFPEFVIPEIAEQIWCTAGGNIYHFDRGRHAMLAQLRVTRTMEKFHREVTEFFIRVEQGHFPEANW